jgi:hypothetical protein
MGRTVCAYMRHMKFISLGCAWLLSGCFVVPANSRGTSVNNGGGNSGATFEVGAGGTGAETGAGPVGFGATVDERKGVTDAEAALAEVVQLVRTQCAAPNFTATIAWQDYLGFTDADFSGRTRANVYSLAGGQIADHLRQLASSCSNASLSGAVRTEMQTLVAHPRVGPVDAAHPSHVFTRAGTGVNLVFHVSTSNTSSDTLQHIL